MLVKHLMTPNPIPVSPDQSVADAGEMMTAKGIRHLPVQDGDGRLLGLVTRSSLARALPGMGTGLTRFEVDYLTSATKVSEVMIKNPVLTKEDEAAEEAARIMNTHRISSLMVMRDDRAVGIITDTDIFKAMLELLGALRHGVRLTVHLPHRAGELSRVSGAIAGVGGNLSAVGSWRVNDDTWGAMLKIENLSEGQILEVLKGLPDVHVEDVRA